MKFYTLLLCLLALTSLSEARYFSTVVIDAGHGGKDKGAYWGGVRESALNLVVAKKLAYELKARGIKTVLTRKSDSTCSYDYRTRLANKYKNSIFVSVHFNANTNTSVKGIETYYLSSEGKKIASKIQPKMVRSLKCRDGGIRRRNYKVLRDTHMPAVLVECGYLSNSRERMRCSTVWYQTTAARVIAEGLMEYRKIK